MADLTFPLSSTEFTLVYANTIDVDALQLLLDAAEEEIIGRAGPTIDGYLVTDRTESFFPHGGSIMLSERATAIVDVVEFAQHVSPTMLAANDYALSADGLMLRRLRTGTTGSYRWRPRVDVTYSPFSDNASRGRVQAELAKLTIAFNPGLASQTIGSWAESYVTSGVPYEDQRASILATLHADPLVMY